MSADSEGEGRINLAVYVIGEVKRQVPGCGLDTDVLYACHGYKPDRVVGDETREIEDALRGFDRILQGKVPPLHRKRFIA